MKSLKQEVELRRSPAIILVRPQLGENIGATARAMLNFGLSDLRLVCPRDGWPNQQATAVASGAGKILENAKIYMSSRDACSDLNFIFAATARDRSLSRDIFSPKSSMIKSLEFIQSGLGVGIMFGPERAGLENNEVSLAQAIVSVPINPKFSSLNLAQCVVLFAYEWFTVNQKQENISTSNRPIKYASLIEVDHLRLALIENLDVAGYFWPQNKEASLIENLTNLLGRLELTSADVRTLHGIIKALVKNKTKY